MKSLINSSSLFKKLPSILDRKFQFNYFYFLLFFLLLLSTNLYNILIIRGEAWVRAFFLFYDLGEMVLGFLGIVFLSVILKRCLHRGFYLLYTGILFVFLLLQLIEIPLVQLMDLSLGEAFHVAFGADLNNFLEFLRLSEVSLWAWYSAFLAILLCPVLGAYIYHVLEKASARKPCSIKLGHFLGMIMLIPITLSTADGCVAHKLSYTEYSAYKKSLPWKRTLLKAPVKNISIQYPLKPSVDPQEFLTRMNLQSRPIQALPNIYLFIAESLRSDYLSHETAPTLMKFKEQYVTPAQALSGANHTIVSWFSIFHSIYPFYWSYASTPQFKEGSLPLNLLKEWGYQIHVYSSAQLKYYHFDEVMLGKDLRLADSTAFFPHHGPVRASDSDQKMMTAFDHDIKHHESQGHVYIFFVDSTHFNYSWPKDFPEKFSPCEEITWKHRLSHQETTLDILKNRYKNSILFIDTLFAKAMETLKTLGRYEESIVVFCGDHGEEFKEEGKLFHASHLSLMQVQIPILYKLGTLQKQVDLSTHIDIFPTIIDYIDPGNPMIKWLDGRSVLDPTKSPFGIVTRFNSCLHPYEFLLYQPSKASVIRFNKKHKVFSSTKLQILREYPLEEAAPHQEVDKILNELFSQGIHLTK